MAHSITVGEAQLMGVKKQFIAEQRKALMTKREQFAAMALQGLLAANSAVNPVERAYEIADAMIIASKNPTSEEPTGEVG